MHFLALLLASVFVAACSHTPTTQTVQTTEAPLVDSENRLVIDAWVSQGFREYQDGNFAKALRTLETAFVYDPQGPDSWAAYVLFSLYFSLGQYENAMGLAKTLVSRFPYRALGYEQLGLAQLWQKMYQPAAENFLRALEFEAHSPRTWFYLGLVRERMGNDSAQAEAFAEAEREYTQVLSYNPRDIAANYELASLYLYWGIKTSEAERLLEVAGDSLEALPTAERKRDFSLHQKIFLPVQSGIVQLRRGNSSGALATFTKALQDAPSDATPEIAEIYYYLGESFRADGKPKVALSFLKKCRTLDPNGPHAFRAEAAIRGLASLPKK